MFHRKLSRMKCRASVVELRERIHRKCCWVGWTLKKLFIKFTTHFEFSCNNATVDEVKFIHIKRRREKWFEGKENRKNGSISFDNVDSSCSDIVFTWQCAQVKPAESPQHAERLNGRSSRRHCRSLKSSSGRREIPQMGWGEWCFLLSRPCLRRISKKPRDGSSWALEEKAEWMLRWKKKIPPTPQHLFWFSFWLDEREGKETKVNSIVNIEQTRLSSCIELAQKDSLCEPSSKGCINVEKRRA